MPPDCGVGSETSSTTVARPLIALRQEQVACTERLLEDETLQTRIVGNDEVYKDRACAVD